MAEQSGIIGMHDYMNFGRSYRIFGHSEIETFPL